MGSGGQGNTDGGESHADLTSDPFYSQFVADSFDVNAFASRSLSGGADATQATARQLTEGIQALDGQIQREVLARQEELLQQVHSVHAAESLTQGITQSVASLQRVVSQAKGEVLGPYEALREQTAQLHALHATVDLLRHLLHHLKLMAKLKAALSPGGDKLTALDLGKAAKLLVEIQVEGEEADLEGLDAAAAGRAFLEHATQQVQEQAEAALREGMGTLSQAGVGSALQIFYNLNQLPQATQGVVEEHAARFERALTLALRTPLTPGKGGIPNAEAAWQRLSQAMEALHSAAVAAWHLQRVLAKKRDPLTHTLFLAALASEEAPLPLPLFWSKAVAALSSGLASSARGGELKAALTSGFPKLAALLEETLAKLLRDTEVKGVTPIVSTADAEAVLQTLEPFQNAFLAETLRHLSAGVTSAYPGGTRPLPSAAELQKCIARMHEEVKAVASSPRLSALTAQCVGTALRQLAERAEYMAATGPEVRGVGGPCTLAQSRNITLCCQLGEIHRSLAALLPRLTAPAASALQGPLDGLEGVATEAVLPIFRAASEGAEQIVLSMHSQDFGGEAAPDVLQASPCMTRLANHLAHIRMEYLSKFTPPVGAGAASFAGALTQRLACRILVFFVRHAALLRPLTQAGKLQLAKDMAELEPILSQYLVAPETLGSAHRQLRAFRALLFAPTPALSEGFAALDSLPRPVVLHHLFSRGPPELQSPHQRSGFTPAQYSLWLDQHSSAEALKYVAAAVKSGGGELAGSQEQEGEGDGGGGREDVTALHTLLQKLCVQ